MATEKSPITIVWVPGAWHSSGAFRKVGDILSSSGYKNVYVDHPSIGPPKAAEDPAVDVKHLRKILIGIIEGGSDAVVVCHSYGGMVTSCATEGLGKKDRLSKGEKHGVVNVLYMCAFALPQGVSLMNALNNTPLPWFDMRDDGFVGCKDSEKIFYADCSTEDQKHYISQLKPHSYCTFNLQVSYEAYKHIPSSYLICDEDQAIPKHAQEGMVAQAGNGAFQIVEHLKASHSPFISMPKETAAFVEKVANQSLA